MTAFNFCNAIVTMQGINSGAKPDNESNEPNNETKHVQQTKIQ